MSAPSSKSTYGIKKSRGSGLAAFLSDASITARVSAAAKRGVELLLRLA